MTENILTHEQIVDILKKQFGDILLDAYETYGMMTVIIPRENIVSFLQFCKEDSTLNFNFLTDLTAVHYPFNEGAELEMVYHIHNWHKNVRMRIKTTLPINDPSIETTSGLWPSANWQERETYDFFGVIFAGHPDLRRIMNVDEMDYFPLLKQYQLEDATREDKDDTMFGRKDQ